MKPTKLLTKLAMLGLLAGAAAPVRGTTFYPSATGVAAVPFSGSYSQDFSGTDTINGANFTGSASLPKGYFVSGSAAIPWATTALTTGTAVSGGGFAAYFDGFAPPAVTNPRAFTMLETSANGNLRVYLAIENSTTGTIGRILAGYSMYQMIDGSRVNSTSLRYDVSGTAGFNGPAIVTLTAPAQANNETDYSFAPSGSSTGTKTPAPSVNGIGLVTLPTPLVPGGTGVFRWQFSTATGSGDRDALGLTQVTLQSVATGTPNTWTGNNDTVWTDANNWTSPTTWSNTGTANAVFNSPSVAVSANSGIKATDLEFASGVTSIAGSGSLALGGIVDVEPGASGTIGIPVSGQFGYILQSGTGSGNGNVVQSAAVTGTNASVTVVSGTLTIGGASVLSSANAVSLQGDLNLNNNNLTVGQLSATQFHEDGVTTTVATLGSGTLTVDNTGTAGLTDSYHGDVQGSGGFVVGSSSDPNASIVTVRFRTIPKTYSGPTVVNNGFLEFDDSSLSNSSSVTVNGPFSVPDITGSPVANALKGEVDLNDSGTGAQSYTLGTSAVTLAGGNLVANESGTTSPTTLTNAVVLSAASGTNTFDNRIYTSGSNTEFVLTGVVSGSGAWRKQGAGDLKLANTANTMSGELNLNNGTVTTASSGTSYGGGYLLLGDSNQAGRAFIMNSDVTAAGVESNDVLTTATTTVNSKLEIGTHTFTDNMPAIVVSGTETKPSFQGDITGSGTFVKGDYGTTRFTVNPKTFTGAFVVSNGVVQISSDGTGGRGVPTSASSITVTDNGTLTQGGQVRLSSGATTVATTATAAGFYTFGGPLVIASVQRGTDSVITSGTGLGYEGGLRYDPDSIQTGTETVQYANLGSPVVIQGDSNNNADIHVNGLISYLYITGSVSGTSAATLDITGGGSVVFSATTDTVTTFNGTNFKSNLDLQNGAVVIAGSTQLGPVTGGTATATVGSGTLGASLGGNGNFGGNVTVSGTYGALSQGEIYTVSGSGTIVDTGTASPVGNLAISGNLAVGNNAKWAVNVNTGTVTVGGTVTTGNSIVIDLNGVGAPGDYNLATMGNFTGSLPTTVTLLHAPAGVTSANFNDSDSNDLTITLAP